MKWQKAEESKPKRGDRVLLKIRYEDSPVVGYWDGKHWDACTENHMVTCGAYCYGGTVQGNFETYEVTHYAEIEPAPDE